MDEVRANLESKRMDVWMDEWIAGQTTVRNRPESVISTDSLLSI